MRPYLSFVIAARNDQHGGEFMDRLLLCLRTIYLLSESHRVPIEILIVEWNPPPGQARLAEQLQPPPVHLPIQLRVIEVPTRIHHLYNSHRLLGMYQMIAKNVGIRRAAGEFILCTNADIIFSERVFAFFAKQRLKRAHFYRCNRCDVAPLPTVLREKGSITEILRYCRKHVQQRLGKNRWYANFPGSSPYWYKHLPMQLVTVVLSQLLRFLISSTHTLYHSLDTWACGDFTLMHRDDWHDIQGYAELDAYSLHVDSLALGAAVALAKKQVILPLSHCTYHISHKDGWEMQSPLEKLRFDLRMPKLDHSTLQELLLHMIRTRQIPPFNTPNWGHAHEDFREEFITQHRDTLTSPIERVTIDSKTQSQLIV